MCGKTKCENNKQEYSLISYNNDNCGFSISSDCCISASSTNVGFLNVNPSTTYQAMPEIEKVIFQKLYTIVIWKNKERTVVKCSEENFDKEKGLAMAIAKRYMQRGKFKKLLENADIQDK